MNFLWFVTTIVMGFMAFIFDKPKNDTFADHDEIWDNNVRHVNINIIFLPMKIILYYY